MIILKGNSMQFRFPMVGRSAGCNISFKRTLRIPDDNQRYSLPPSLGNFPLHHVDDFSNLPENYVKRGGIFFPMYQSEAMWISFNGMYPCAVKIAAGKINAVSGESWSEGLSSDKQDYIVSDKQPWLDGFNVSKGMIRQFVAMPLGQGFTAEEQITNKFEFGGLQVIVYPMRADIYEKLYPKNLTRSMREMSSSKKGIVYEDSCMGLGAGGLMKQEIYQDLRGVDVWDTENSSRCFIHIMNSNQYHQVTSSFPTTPPPSAKDYNEAGLPWFNYYSDNPAIKGASILKGLKSVGAKTIEDYGYPLDDNNSLEEISIKNLHAKKIIREVDF